MDSKLDVTEALRQSRERFNLVLDGSDKLAIQGYTADGTITFWNRASELLYGYSASDAVGQNILDLLHTAESRIDEQALMDDILATDNLPPPCEMQIVTSTGKPVWIYCNRMLVRQPDRPPEFFCFDIDVTERKQAEVALQTMQRLESLGVLAGGIAHDFNNVLTGLFGNMELAQLQLAPDDPASQHLKTARLALDRAIGLTRQLLTFAKGEAPVMGAVDLRTLLAETAHFNLSGSNIHLQENISVDLHTINGDRTQLERVLANIIINARDAMPDGGTLHISADNADTRDSAVAPLAPGPYVCIRIRDEGQGIPEDMLNRIFEPYFSTKSTGTGLGLAIVHSILTKHHGTIQVDSGHTRGTTFTIWLPSACATQTLATQLRPEPAASAHKLRILVMDDDDLIRAYLEAALATLGHHVTTTAEGDSAVLCYKQAMQKGERFDAVILDLTIRGGTGGLATAQQLLALDRHVRMIMSSGYSQSATVANYEEYGFLGRLEKPFKLDELVCEIDRVIASHH